MLNPALFFLLVPPADTIETAGPPPPLRVDDKPIMNQWTGSLSASAIITDGNSETRTANATADAQYRREKDRTTLGAFWNYQDDSTGVLQRRTGSKAKYDYFFRPKTYALAQTSVENDMQADLDLRWIFGVGIGEQFIENLILKVSAELGVSWVDERFGSSPDSDYLAGRAAYTVDWNINKDWTFFNAGEIYPSLEDGDDVYAKVDTRIKVTLTDKMFAQAQWVMDWDNTPAAGKERVDNRYILTVGWAF
ncbi:MAG TPA: DUF481 domain-containing protein [Planctomycetota bacterium]|nr:DUF481 domain-containing protein [Planctomycetota bacterium]